jgi:hypothetical protein
LDSFEEIYNYQLISGEYFTILASVASLTPAREKYTIIYDHYQTSYIPPSDPALSAALFRARECGRQQR